MAVHGRHSPTRRGKIEACRFRTTVLCAVLVFALLPALPGLGLVSTTITLDGVFTDWSPVYDDAANCQYDITGDAGNTNADLTLVASTWDTTYLYHYFRRAAATGGAAPTLAVFIDLDGDQRMETGDRVLEYRLTGGNSYSGATLYAYVPADAANGDAMGGTIPGTWPTQITFGTPPYLGFGEPSGAQFEGRITWTALGVTAGSPIALQFAATQGSTTDYTGVVSLKSYGVTVTPDNAAGAAADSTVIYPHTIKNTGNTPSRFDITATSSKGWAVWVRRASDQQTITYADLAPGATLDIEVAVVVPPNAPGGTRDTTTVRARHQIAGVEDSATDVTTVGPLLVVPDRSGSIMAGGTIVFENTIMNNTANTYTVSLSAVSDKGWTANVWNSLGTAQITSIDLAPNESKTVTVRVTVPAGTASGTSSVTTVEARAVGFANVRGKGYDTATVRPELDISPDNAYPAGAGTSVLYRHTVTNSSAEDRTITLSASSGMGWPVAVLAADASTPLVSVALPAYGGSAEVVVRVTVPAGTAVPNTDTTTVTARYGAGLAETATDVTTVSRLATYGISGFGTPQDTFDLGDRVYARGMGLPPGSTMTFRYSDPSGAVISTSSAKVDATGIAQTSYNIPSALTGLGTWTVTLLNGTTVVDSTPFYVGYKATISALAASGGDVIGTPVSVTATLSNTGVVALTGTTVDYRIWWDDDGSGTLTAGDSYIAEDGTWTPIGTGTGYTMRRTGVTVTAPNGTFSDAWSVPNDDFRQSGMYRLTATWSSGTQIDERTTEFFAVPGRPALSLTVSKTSVDFGTVEPGVTYTDPGIAVHVSSLSDYALQTTLGGQYAELGLASSLAAEILGAVTDDTGYTDSISITVPWATNPGAYSANVTYTIVAR